MSDENIRLLGTRNSDNQGTPECVKVGREKVSRKNNTRPLCYVDPKSKDKTKFALCAQLGRLIKK